MNYAAYHTKYMPLEMAIKSKHSFETTNGNVTNDYNQSCQVLKSKQNKKVEGSFEFWLTLL